MPPPDDNGPLHETTSHVLTSESVEDVHLEKEEDISSHDNDDVSNSDKFKSPSLQSSRGSTPDANASKPWRYKNKRQRMESDPVEMEILKQLKMTPTNIRYR